MKYKFDLNSLTDKGILVEDIKLVWLLKMLGNCTGYRINLYRPYSSTFVFKFYPKDTLRDINYKWLKNV